MSKYEYNVLALTLTKSRRYVFIFDNIYKICMGYSHITKSRIFNGLELKYYNRYNELDLKKIMELVYSANLQQLGATIRGRSACSHEVLFRDLKEEVVPMGIVPIKASKIYGFKSPTEIPHGQTARIRQEYEERFLLIARHFVLTGEINEFSAKCLNDYPTEILYCSICHEDIREKGDIPLYSKEEGIICITCCLIKIRNKSLEHKDLIDCLFKEGKRNQLIRLIQSGKFDIKKVDFCRVCEDLLYNPDRFPEVFNEKYKLCCTCRDALVAKVKGLNRPEALNRFEKYEDRFREIFFIQNINFIRHKTLKKDVKYNY